MANFSSHNATYRTPASVIMSLLYFYIMVLILLFGAVINVETYCVMTEGGGETMGSKKHRVDRLNLPMKRTAAAVDALFSFRERKFAVIQYSAWKSGIWSD